MENKLKRLERIWEMYKISNIHLSKDSSELFKDSQFYKFIRVNEYLSDDEILMIGRGYLCNLVMNIDEVLRLDGILASREPRGVLSYYNIDDTEIALSHKGEMIKLANVGGVFMNVDKHIEEDGE